MLCILSYIISVCTVFGAVKYHSVEWDLVDDKLFKLYMLKVYFSYISRQQIRIVLLLTRFFFFFLLQMVNIKLK